MISFYAFCRIIDDLADEPCFSPQEKQDGLARWKQGIVSGFSNPSEIESSIVQIIERYQIPKKLFVDLIEGCESDLQPQRFQSWEELKEYTYRVACCVGLISIKIFGCTHPDSERYAIALGHALQITNILRDVSEDLSEGMRIYLPLNDMIRFQYSERDLVGKVYDGRFQAMMEYQAQRAETYFKEATDLLPQQDRQALKAAEGMRKIYYRILLKMKQDQFQVFKQRYSLSKPQKMWSILSTMFTP